MSRTSLIIAFMLLLTLSCEEGYITDCSACYTSNNYEVILWIKYQTLEDITGLPVVTLYEGNVNDSLILDRFYVTDSYSAIRYHAILYKDYSATLEFTIDDHRYKTTAAACPKVRYDETTCDEPCWYIYDNVIDLRIRYD